MILFLIFSIFIQSISSEKLLMAQTLWRHGERTPTGPYPSDPYQEEFWGVPWGELTTNGMSQHFQQGQRLRARYMDETGLLQKKYSRYETTVRSADTPRCIESAMANMAAFYSDSPTFPSSTNGWPASWTPVPVHSRPHDEDRELESGVSCPRATQLRTARENLSQFQDFLASKWQLFAAIFANAGGNFDVSMYTLSHIYGILRVEHEDFNLTMPDWVTDNFYSDLLQANYEGEDFSAGGAGFGLPEDTELVRLRGGFMLKELVQNINDVISNSTSTKYFVYSGHDTIQRSLMLTLNVKDALIGPGNPDYTAVIACELWEKNGEHFIKMLFAKDWQSNLVDFTSLLPINCPDNLCPVSEFLKYAEKYMPKGEEDCVKK